ncbi:hypothetical protein I5G59_gp96 [Mycobacterium phage LilMcDreamy]|uniref:Uncharacterized protein n=1 Tax=Mycobacterium phage LilMcDreamy TaxID=2652422 RepID=A0A5P8D6S3_9CAUD|nr:hypothetical protein I5G59_gp96 [Mycobacterium phage LilMcDreamy]QFP94716.1 hypothetical protein SEA_LILMCDREAMY_96 [Mycobacterium phage LilMcDreamy]
MSITGHFQTELRKLAERYEAQARSMRGFAGNFHQMQTYETIARDLHRLADGDGAARDQREYRVSWDIDLTADDFVDAAQRALTIHRDDTSTATIFGVTDTETGEEHVVDLSEMKMLDLTDDRNERTFR